MCGVVSLAGVVSTLLWRTGMQSTSLEETMGECFRFCCLDVSDLMSVLTAFRKNMLNDLLRFDVKDCSWCR